MRRGMIEKRRDLWYNIFQKMAARRKRGTPINKFIKGGPDYGA